MGLSPDHKAKIAAAISKDTPERIAELRRLRNSLPITKIAKILGVHTSTINSWIKKYNILLTDEGRQRALTSIRTSCIGKVPWNKDGRLSEETKLKIGAALAGANNYRYRNPMTEAEKVKLRASYAANGIHKMRAWLQSPEGQDCSNRSKAHSCSIEFRGALSTKISTMIAGGSLRIVGYTQHGYLATAKGGTIYYHSSYERDYALLLDDNPEVISFRSQPLQIQYQFDGCLRNYTPDFLVEYIWGTVLVEIKPFKLIDLPINVAKFEAARNYCRERDLQFSIVTELDIYSPKIDRV